MDRLGSIYLLTNTLLRLLFLLNISSSFHSNLNDSFQQQQQQQQQLDLYLAYSSSSFISSSPSLPSNISIKNKEITLFSHIKNYIQHSSI
ncbi:hypothetical protein EYC84_001308 [Monilinia fructicola]|uniref:Uncharacterized protein n=1 Tax=Monilinia fructicola TaxID=38448 RepID=A0A5M9JMV1_MONFR|nr:hypothetical protein EYC84_001308 [Monilinia fructicola]